MKVVAAKIAIIAVHTTPHHTDRDPCIESLRGNTGKLYMNPVGLQLSTVR